jgi:hypothetical protein
MPKFPSNWNFHALQIRDLIDPILSRWKAPTIYALFDSNLAQEILKICISSKLDPAYIWTPFTSGRFSTASTYQFITASISNISSSSTIPKLWQSYGSKISMIGLNYLYGKLLGIFFLQRSN